MEHLKDNRVVVAGIGRDGRAAFLAVEPPFRSAQAGALEASWAWSVDAEPELPTKIGAVPTTMSFPGPGGSRFGLLCFPANSAGRRDLHAGGELPNRMHSDGYDDPSMHRTDTIDYEVIISGSIDIVLPNGDYRTLGPGDCLVLGGVGHLWRNRYDEPCVYAAVIIGAHGTVASE